MKVAIYNIQSGEILRFFNGPSSAVDIQVGEGEEFYLNCPDTVTHIVDNTPTLLAARRCRAGKTIADSARAKCQIS